MSTPRAILFSVFFAACVGGEDTDDSLKYDVVRGDTLSKIAKRHGVPLRQLMDHNHLESDRIEVGQVLWIPHHAASTPGTSPPPERRPRASKKPASPPGPPRPASAVGKLQGPSLSMPPKKRCISAPTMADLEAEDGALWSQGLNRSQVSNAMSTFIPKLDPCFTGLQSSPSGTLMFDIKVACTGRVQKVRVLSRDDWPQDVATCVQQAFQYIPFPAHDIPDGYGFQYPLSIQ